MQMALLIVRSAAVLVAAVGAFGFALGAIAGASTVMIIAGLFDRWDRGERR